MEWLTCIRKTLEYIDSSLLKDLDLTGIANEVNISPMFLQNGFSIMTGYTISEYIRNRRLYEAAIDITTGDQKIIDIAYKYLYETPESFTKAFTRFHNATPREIKNKEKPIHSFLPLKINILITGGHNMEYKIKKLEGFKVIGFKKEFKLEEAQKLIPQFWDEVFSKYAKFMFVGKEPSNEYEQAFIENSIGEFGICIDTCERGTLTYLIGGKYNGGKVLEGMTLYELPVGEWAIFDCYGPIPNSIQKLSDEIYKEWLPGNPDFEINGNASVEWYDGPMSDNENKDYHSAVWIPIKRKN